MEKPAELPARALEWIASAAPRAVAHVAPIGGGITNTKWLVTLVDGSRLVMRWEDPVVWGRLGREHVHREALACRVLSASGLPVPTLIAGDVDGTSTDGSANLMTWRPGRTRLDPLGPGAITELARVVVALHRRPVAHSQELPVFTLRRAIDPAVPGWARWPHLWRRALDLTATAPPPPPCGLLHGDLHLGNLLWRDDEVTGLIDWAETSWGPPDVDVAHLCSDFAMMHSALDAERFRSAYLRAGGRLDPDPDAARFWMISDIIGFLPDPAHILPAVHVHRPDITADQVRQRLEQLLQVTLVGPAA
ncbi:MAG TPA: aminoglycoside phosphotransferase family protein [Microlunatus sp.]|nr:aminoglycoside phosphotransferase family protein [Microlunatus sp.]